MKFTLLYSWVLVCCILISYFRAVGNKLLESLIIFPLLENFGPVHWKILTHYQHFIGECQLNFSTGLKKYQEFAVCTEPFYTMVPIFGVCTIIDDVKISDMFQQKRKLI